MPGPARTAQKAAGAKAGLGLDFLNVAVLSYRADEK
jgi:hypothetical protein